MNQFFSYHHSWFEDGMEHYRLIDKLELNFVIGEEKEESPKHIIINGPVNFIRVREGRMELCCTSDEITDRGHSDVFC